MQQPQVAPEKKTAAKRQRSPVERGLVWGVIVALYLVVVFEWRAKYAYEQALPEIQAAITEAEKSGDPIGFDVANRIMKKDPSEKTQGKYGITKVWIYSWRWRSLFKSYAIKVTVDQQDESVLFLDTEQ